MAVTYTIALPEPAQARGDDPALAFSAHGADGLAQLGAGCHQRGGCGLTGGG